MIDKKGELTPLIKILIAVLFFSFAIAITIIITNRILKI
jgi:hypothetical protein